MSLNWIWIGLTIVVIAADYLSSDFTYSWLILGFIPAFLIGFVVDFEIQLLIAIILGGISIVIGLKISRKYIKRTFKKESLTMGKYIGKVFVSEEDIFKEKQIKVNGIYWNVKNVGDTILKGESFKVVSVDGNKLIIKKGDE
ncbi:NfeD family protein [Clostridium senegalense]